MWPWPRFRKARRLAARRDVVSLFLETLEARCVLTGADFAGAVPVDFHQVSASSPAVEQQSDSVITVIQASPLGFAPVEGTIVVPFTRNLYEFTPLSDGSVTIHQKAVFNGGTDLDSYLTVYNAAGELLAVSDNDNLSRDSVVRINVMAGTTYRLAAGGHGGSVGDYVLTLAKDDAFTDDVANVFAGATVIAIASDRAGRIDAPGDQDMYRFIAPKSGSLEIRQDSGDDLDSFLTVFNSAREQIAFDDDSGNNFHSLLRFNVVAGQTYYVRAAAAARGTTGDYVLHFTTRGGFTEEVGNSLGEARALDLDAFGLGDTTGNIDVFGDQDMYRFVAPITGGLTIQQGPIRGSGLSSHLTLLAVDGTQLGFSDNGDGLSLNSLIHVNVIAGEVYYVQAAAYTSTGAYQLFVVPDVHPPLERESEPKANTGGNDDLVSADVLFGQTDLVGILSPGDVDVFKFTQTAAGTMSARIDTADPLLFPRLQLFDQAGQLLLQTDVVASSLDIYLQTGSYYLVVSALGSDIASGYEMHARFTGGEDPIDSRPLAVGTQPRALATGDFNQDGQLDLVAANVGSGNLSLLFGQSGGDFQPQPAIAVLGVRTVIVGDFNRDGRDDLAVGGLDSVQVLLGRGDGSFQNGAAFTLDGPVRALVTGDFNDDRRPDLAVLQVDNVLLLLGQGDGTFREGTQTPVVGAVALTARDFDRDGLLDLAVARSESVMILLGAGSSFTAGTTYDVGTGVRGIQAGDFDGDHKIDLATVNAGDVSILLGRGNGLFRAATSIDAGDGPQALAVGDFNGDGKQDLVTANRFNFVALMLGKGNGAFEPPNGFGAGFDPTAMVPGDFNGDGRLDLTTTNANGTLSIMLNAAPARSQPFLHDAADATGVASRHVPLLGDVDGDRIEDLVILDRSGKLLFRRGLASGSFAPPRIINPNGPARDVTLIGMGAHQGIAAVERGSDTAAVYVWNGTTQRFVVTAHIATGLLPVRIVAADLDSDGFDDLAIASALDNNLALAFQVAPGRFAATEYRAVGSTPSSIVAVDLGDSGLDLLVTGQRSGDVTVLLNDLDHTFANRFLFRAGTGPLSTEVSPLGTRVRATLDTADSLAADFTGDGIVDVVVLDRAARGFALLTGQGGGSFANPVSFATNTEPTGLATGDFNHDGRPDLAVLVPERKEIWVYLNDEGTFAEPLRSFAGAEPAGFSVAADGRLLVGNEFGDVLTLLGDGTGAFTVDREDFREVPLAVTDLNGDGLADVVLADQSLDRVSVLFREPGTTDFTAPTLLDTASLLAPGAVQLTDLDSDNQADLVVASSLGNKVLVYRGLGDGQFAAPVDYAVGFDPRSLTIADLNGDRVPDLAVANHGSNDISILLGKVASAGWQAAPGPRLNSRGQGPLSVAVADQNRDRIPDLIVKNSDGLIAALPGIGSGGFGTGFFRDLDPLTLNAGPIRGDSGPFILGDLGIQRLNPDFTLTTVFAARDVQAISAQGSLIVAAFDDGHLGLLDDGVLIKEFNQFLDQPSALEILQNGNNLEVYISQVGREVPVIVTGAEFIAVVTNVPAAVDVVEGTTLTGPELLLLATLLPGMTTKYPRAEEVRSEAVDDMFVQVALAQDMVPIVEASQVNSEMDVLLLEPSIDLEVASPGEAFQLGLDDAFAQRTYWQQMVNVAVPVADRVIDLLRPLQNWRQTFQPDEPPLEDSRLQESEMVNQIDARALVTLSGIIYPASVLAMRKAGHSPTEKPRRRPWLSDVET